MLWPMTRLPPAPPAASHTTQATAAAGSPPEGTLPGRNRRGHGRTTLADVADAAGVTKITVSRYLRQPALVATDTGARIALALSHSGYVPNKQAGMLASGRSGMVAAIVPSVANSVFAETVQGLSEGLQPAGLELMLASSGYSLQREEEQIRTVLGWSPDALVVVGHHHTAGALALLRAAAGAGTPVIELWDITAADAEFLQIGFDHAEVGRAMARHLVDAGYRRMAYVDTGVADDFRAHERGKAFRAEAARALGGRRAKATGAVAAAVQMLTAPAGDAFDGGRAALHQLLAVPAAQRADAVAFANDHLACGAWLEAQRLGLAVPDQLALLGFGDFALARQLAGGISSVHLPRYDIGAEAARQMLALLALPPEQRQPALARRHAVPWQLLARGSTAAKP